MPDNIDRLLEGTHPLDDLTRDPEDFRAAMRRVREARYAMPDAERLFPRSTPTVDDFNALVDNRAWLWMVSESWRRIHTMKMALVGGGAHETVQAAVAEGLAMFLAIFDDMEREVFPEDETSDRGTIHPAER